MHRIALVAPSPFCGEGGWAPGHKRRSAVLFFVCACSLNVEIFRLPRQSFEFSIGARHGGIERYGISPCIEPWVSNLIPMACLVLGLPLQSRALSLSPLVTLHPVSHHQPRPAGRASTFRSWFQSWSPCPKRRAPSDASLKPRAKLASTGLPHMAATHRGTNTCCSFMICCTPPLPTRASPCPGTPNEWRAPCGARRWKRLRVGSSELRNASVERPVGEGIHASRRR